MESTRIRMVTDAEFAELGLLGGLRRLVEEAGLARTLSVGLGAMLAKQVSSESTELSVVAARSLGWNAITICCAAIDVEPSTYFRSNTTRTSQVPYTYGKQVSFDVVAKYLYRILNAPRPTATTLAESLSKSVGPETIKWMVSVLSAMVASVMACLFSQPGDVILTETYKGGDEGGGEKASRSLGEVSTAIYARRGDRGAVRALSGFFTGLQARFVHVGLIITSQLVIYDLVKQLLGLPATGSH
ncbi:hypothetical protein ACHAWF_007464 [Thalassiosira exigua]